MPRVTENDELLQALQHAASASAAKGEDAAARRRVYEATLTANLLLPVNTVPAGAHNGDVTTQGVYDFFSDALDDGKYFSAVFTHEAALRHFAPAGPFVRMPGRAVCQLMLDADIDRLYINAFHAHPVAPGGFFTRRELEPLAAGMVPIVMGPHVDRFESIKASGLDVRPPRRPLSADLMAALLKAVVDRPEVVRVALFDLSVEGQPARPTVGLEPARELSATECNNVIERLAAALAPFLQGQMLDFVFVNEALLRQTEDRGQILYRRS